MAEVGKINKVSASDVGLLDNADAANIAKVNTLTFSQSVPLLDDYPGAAAAYSVRKLRSTYSGSAMRVRRTVAPFDETDIGFDGGDLDEAAIVSFGGSDPLTVSVWYDQSGSSNDASQATAASQPQIYDGASVITENGQPAIQSFSSSSNYLTFSTITSTDFCFINVRTYKTAPSMGYGGPSGNFAGYALNPTVTRYRWSGVTSNFPSNLSDGIQYLDFANRASNSMEAHFNGVSAGVTANSGAAVLNILMGGNGIGSFLEGKTQELIIYSSDQSSNRSGIDTNINDYFNIF